MQPPIPLKRPAWLEEFQSFIMKGNVVDLAVGIIIGAAFTGVVGSLVKDLFTPVIGLLVGGIDFSNIFITLKGPSTTTLEAAKAAGAVTLNVGLFLNATVKFLIVAWVLFMVVKGINLMKRRAAADPTPPVPAPPSKEEVLLTEIRDALRAQSKA